MGVTTYEGIIEEDHRVRLLDAPHLSEHTRVYVIVPDAPLLSARLRSPRLANPRQIDDFTMRVTNLEVTDAEL